MEVDDTEEEEFGFSRNYFLSKELTRSSKKSASKLSDIDLVSEQVSVWGKKMVHIQFNWCWYHVPTFAPYKAESIFCPLVLTNTRHTQTAKSAAIVLQALTPNAQSVFKVLAQYQLAHSDEGLLVSSLYNMCPERFLVGSQLTPNAHLTEFKDHNLVRTRRHSDGGDCLYIPLTSDALEKLMQEIA